VDTPVSPRELGVERFVPATCWLYAAVKVDAARADRNMGSDVAGISAPRCSSEGAAVAPRSPAVASTLSARTPVGAASGAAAAVSRCAARATRRAACRITIGAISDPPAEGVGSG